MDKIPISLPAMQGHPCSQCAPSPTPSTRKRSLLQSHGMVYYLLSDACLTGSLPCSWDVFSLIYILWPLYSCAPTCPWWILVTLQSLAQVQLLSKAFSDILTGWDRGLLLLYAKHAPRPSLYSPSFILPWTVGSSLDVHFPSTRLQARGTETTFYLSLYHPPQSVSFVGT